MRLAINKKQDFSSLPEHQLAENAILGFGFCEEAKKDKGQFVTKFFEIVVTFIFM